MLSRLCDYKEPSGTERPAEMPVLENKNERQPERLEGERYGV